MTEPDSSGGSSRKLVLLAAFALGVSCVMTQLILLREMLCAFAGNELVLGLALGNWLLLMGLGAGLGCRAGRIKEPLSTLAALLLFTAILPPAQVFALRGLRSFVFLRGADVGVMATVVTTFAVLLPYCLAAGFALTLGCWILAQRGDERGAGRVYVADSLGSIAGGLAFSFVLVRWLDHFALLCVPAIFNLTVAALMAWRLHARLLDQNRNEFASSPRDSLSPGLQPPSPSLRAEERAGRRGVAPTQEAASPRPSPPSEGSEGAPRADNVAVLLATPSSKALDRLDFVGKSLIGVAALLGLGLLALASFGDADAVSTSLQFPGQQLLFRGNSAYGRLVVTTAASQTNVLESGVTVASLPNLGQAEETAHYAMAQRPGASRVLLISGTLTGVPREILRHRIGELHCVEMDPLVAATARWLMRQELADRRVRWFTKDPRQYVRRTGVKYDVVILALPDPSTAQLNRLFTTEFFGEIKRVLAPGGVVEFALGRYENHVSPELARLLSCGRATVAAQFKNVALIPGGRVFFLASDGPLTYDIAAALERLQIKPLLVNRNYLSAMLTRDRLPEVSSAAAQPAPVNHDLSPRLYLLHLRHWASQFEARSSWLPIALVVVFGVYLIRLRGAALVIFASGFAGTALEIVLLLSLQVLVGSLYQQVGLLVTLFMAGLALGAFVMDRAWLQAGEKQLAALAAAVALLAVLLPVMLLGLAGAGSRVLGSAAVQFVIWLLTLLLSALLGMQFPLANRLVPAATRPTASRMYSADFVGASLGALLTSTLLIPLLGITGACLLVAGLNLLAAGGLLWKKGIA